MSLPTTQATGSVWPSACKGAASATTVLVLVMLVAGCAPRSARVDEARATAVETVDAGSTGVLRRTAEAGAHEMRVVGTAGPQPVSTAAQAPDVGDVWLQIREGLSFPESDRRRVGAEIEWFSRNQTYVDRVAARARYYLPFITAEVERRGLPMELALLPVVESAFQPYAFSPAGASGLWQFMPSTGRTYGLRQTWWYDGRRDVVESTRAALDYLERLAGEFSDDWLLAVAAYNSGEGNVGRAIRHNRRAGKPTDFWSLRLPRETRAYVPRLLAVAAIVADPERYGLELPPIRARNYFAVVPIQGQLDLAIASDVTGVSLDEIHLLNPGFNRFATAPRGPHRLLVPAASAERAGAALAELAPEERLGWKVHRVEAGDSLGAIAHRNRTSVGALREANAIRDTRIAIGDELRVPVAAYPAEHYALSEDAGILMGRRKTSGGTLLAYRVRSGDSLWLIARRHGTSVRRLAAWNGISTRATLRPGQRLVMWGDPAQNAKTPSPARKAETRRGAGLYVVRNGDNLWLIARRHQISVRDLTAWNDISSRDTLAIGQELRLRPVSASRPTPRPGAYTVRRGDSLWEISRRFDVSVAALREANGLSAGATLRPGQRLTLPAAAVARGT